MFDQEVIRRVSVVLENNKKKNTLKTEKKQFSAVEYADIATDRSCSVAAEMTPT